MPRYFISTNASRNYTAGGRSFVFEPVAQRGGSWLGVLALDASSDADILLSGGFPQVAEINLERFDSLKKKLAPSQNTSPTSPTRQKPVGLVVADHAGQSSVRGAAAVDPARDPNSTSGMSFISLMSAPVSPPHEPLLEQNTPRGRPRARIK